MANIIEAEPYRGWHPSIIDPRALPAFESLGGPASIQQLMRRAFAGRENETALVKVVDPELLIRYSYAEVQEYADQIRKVMDSLGLTQTSSIVTALPICPGIFATYHACYDGGYELVPVRSVTAKPSKADREKAEGSMIHRQSVTNATVLIASHDLVDGLSSAVKRVFRHIYSIDETVGTGTLFEAAAKLATTPVPLLPDIQPLNPALVLFTSGSTGKLPKAIQLTQLGYATNAGVMVTEMNLAAQNRVLCALDFGHANGSHRGATTTPISGAQPWLMDGLREEQCMDLIIDQGLDRIPLIPTQIESFNAKAKRYPRLKQLRDVMHANDVTFFASSDRLTESTRRLHWNTFRSHIQVQLGSTEGGIYYIGMRHRSPNESPEISELVGKPLPTFDLVMKPLENPEGLPFADLPLVTEVGEMGVAHISGPSVARRYMNEPDNENFYTDKDGKLWFNTNDSFQWVWVDGEKQLSFDGRVDDVFKIGGERGSSPAVEAYFQDAEGISIRAIAVDEAKLVEFGVLEKTSKFNAMLAAIVMVKPGTSFEEADRMVAEACSKMPLEQSQAIRPRLVLFVEGTPVAEGVAKVPLGTVRKQFHEKGDITVKPFAEGGNTGIVRARFVDYRHNEGDAPQVEIIPRLFGRDLNAWMERLEASRVGAALDRTAVADLAIPVRAAADHTRA